MFFRCYDIYVDLINACYYMVYAFQDEPCVIQNFKLPPVSSFRVLPNFWSLLPICTPWKHSLGGIKRENWPRKGLIIMTKLTLRTEFRTIWYFIILYVLCINIYFLVSLDVIF